MLNALPDIYINLIVVSNQLTLELGQSPISIGKNSKFVGVW